jgi:hypothetical protein
MFQARAFTDDLKAVADSFLEDRPFTRLVFSFLSGAAFVPQGS